MTLLKRLEAEGKRFDGLAEAWYFRGYVRMSALFRSLSRACWRLSWVAFVPPYTEENRKPRDG